MGTSLIELRVKALRKGYHIYYPGIYCETATIYSDHGDKHTVNMGDAVRGLQEIAQYIDNLPELEPDTEYPQVWTPDGMQHTFTDPDTPIQPNLF